MKKLIASVIVFAPLLSFAEPIINDESLVNKLTSIGNTVISLLIAFAVIWIIYSVVKYLIAGDETTRKEGGLRILWGIVGLAIILSIWGLVAILTNTTGTAGKNTPDLPKIDRVILP